MERNDMSLKLKALGLGFVAALAMSAMVAVNAGATQSGHFTSEVAHTILDIKEEGEHRVKLHAFGQPFECEASKVSYHATINSATVTEISGVAPTYGTTPATWVATHCTAGGQPAMIHMNGCTYTFTSRATPEVNHGTVHLVCPGASGPVITINSSLSSHDCWVEITPNQTPTGGVTYKTIGTAGAGHELTANVTASGIHAVITTAGGNFFACGTSSTTTATAEMTGSVTIKGTNTETKQVGITAT
jgi:hypothetical protein